MDFNHWPVFIFLCLALFDVALCTGPDVSNILLCSFKGNKMSTESHCLSKSFKTELISVIISVWLRGMASFKYLYGMSTKYGCWSIIDFTHGFKRQTKRVQERVAKKKVPSELPALRRISSGIQGWRQHSLFFSFFFFLPGSFVDTATFINGH